MIWKYTQATLYLTIFGKNQTVLKNWFQSSERGFYPGTEEEKTQKTLLLQWRVHSGLHHNAIQSLDKESDITIVHVLLNEVGMVQNWKCLHSL